MGGERTEHAEDECKSSLPAGDVYWERHSGSDMKGIQVSIDVSESEIIPKAFKRPPCQGFS
ncbi:Hypothetical predicted protein [Podarcis lilfordi]|uniref:Uncharacterized protein n=1 Tax=Podarcis lilfordi TaxID=74358 RepID=A0AA35JMW8_9SAUR|nr:Hypothetical predicted protein [Podarcis lilfordi]